jgi:hypothetical protein
MTANGISQMIRRRGRQAGIEAVHPHRSGTPSRTNGYLRAAPNVT